MPCNINSSTHTANVGLNKIQFRAIHCVGAGSRMLESVVSQVGVMRDGPRVLYGRLSGSSPALTTRFGSLPNSMSNTMRSKVIPCMELLIGKRSIRFD